MGLPGTEFEGKCLTCEDANCASCDRAAGICLECKAGFYLENYDCQPCGGVCLECESKDVCTKCDPQKSELNESTQ